MWHPYSNCHMFGEVQPRPLGWLLGHFWVPFGVTFGHFGLPVAILGTKKAIPKKISKKVQKGHARLTQQFSSGECAALKEYPPDHSQETQKPRGPQSGDPEAQHWTRDALRARGTVADI